MRTKLEIQHDLALRIKELREKAGLTQEFVGKELHFSKQTIGKWEDPTLPTFPRPENYERLCRLYRCTLEALLCMDQPSTYDPAISYNRMISYEGNGFKWVLDDARLDAYSANRDVKEGVELLKVISSPIQQSFEASRFAGMLDTYLSKILELILHLGIAQITEVESDEEEANSLRKYFGQDMLLKAYIAKASLPHHDFVRPLYTELIARLALQPIIDSLQQAQSFGITSGRMIGRLIELMPFDCLGSKEAIALLNAKTWGSGVQVSTSANAFIARLAYKNTDLQPHFMPYVNPQRRSEEYFQRSGQTEQQELRMARDTLDHAKNVDLALISLARFISDLPGLTLQGLESRSPVAEMTAEEQQRVSGSLLFRLIDVDGNRIGTQENQAQEDALFYSIDLDDLRKMVLGKRKKEVWLLTGHSANAPTMRAAIKGRYANCLATTSETARRIREI